MTHDVVITIPGEALLVVMIACVIAVIVIVIGLWGIKW